MPYVDTAYAPRKIYQANHTRLEVSAAEVSVEAREAAELEDVDEGLLLNLPIITKHAGGKETERTRKNQGTYELVIIHNVFVLICRGQHAGGKETNAPSNNKRK